MRNCHPTLKKPLVWAEGGMKTKRRQRRRSSIKKKYYSGFSREMKPIGCIPIEREIHFKEMALIIMNAGKSKICRVRCRLETYGRATVQVQRPSDDRNWGLIFCFCILNICHGVVTVIVPRESGFQVYIL